MPKQPIDLKLKLSAIIEAKRIARSGLEEAEKKLVFLIKERKKLMQNKKNVTKITFLIEFLEEELEKITEAASNAQHGCNIDGGVGFGSGGGSGTDAG